MRYLQGKGYCLKEYNIGRHYKSKHASTYNDLSGKLRSDKFEILKQNLLAQQSIFTKRSCQNESRKSKFSSSSYSGDSREAVY
ncbi:Uncharacterized protein FWK35_00034444 [Aphis craccivora]|uniref:Uncharacterized protein n=1 Tax=Aphis craccivora TaxID=307492 RepID=A0A6G0W6N0_APHCR|nr:Uncharacterized protein FWK35_00034444 [Aphis craccivora]